MRFFMKKGDKEQRYESVTAKASICYEQISLDPKHCLKPIIISRHREPFSRSSFLVWIQEVKSAVLWVDNVLTPIWTGIPPYCYAKLKY